MHIVVALYKENPVVLQQYLAQVLAIPSIASRRPLIFIYVKGGSDIAARVTELGFAHKVIELPNIGREQQTYLQHIVSHYEDLPGHIFFTQALPNYDSEVLQRLQSHFSSRTGVLGLGVVVTCTCDGHSKYSPYSGSRALIRLREVWAMAQGTFCPREFACFHNGFLMVSRSRLHLQPKTVYEYLLSLFAQDKSSSLRSDEQPSATSQPKTDGWPILGHVLERSWNALLYCTSTTVARDCGMPCDPEPKQCTEMEQCQCLDPVPADALLDLRPVYEAAPQVHQQAVADNFTAQTQTEVASPAAEPQSQAQVMASALTSDLFLLGRKGSSESLNRWAEQTGSANRLVSALGHLQRQNL